MVHYNIEKYSCVRESLVDPIGLVVICVLVDVSGTYYIHAWPRRKYLHQVGNSYIKGVGG